jgi:hypothetical protein
MFDIAKEIDDTQSGLDCKPDYTEKIETLLLKLKEEYNVTVTFVKVPEELKDFFIEGRSKVIRGNPTNIVIPDSMNQYAMYSWIKQYASTLMDLAASQSTKEETEKMIEKIKESINND